MFDTQIYPPIIQNQTAYFVLVNFIKAAKVQPFLQQNSYDFEINTFNFKIKSKRVFHHTNTSCFRVLRDIIKKTRKRKVNPKAMRLRYKRNLTASCVIN